MKKAYFEWDAKKNAQNIKKHGVSFSDQQAFFDLNRVIAEDMDHSDHEKRYYCFVRVERGILTARFTYRANAIRIFGVGRKGKKYMKPHKKRKYSDEHIGKM